MRRTFYSAIVLLILFFVGNVSANTLSDASNITFQVIVSEAETIKHCDYNYVSHELNVSRKNSRSCQFNQNKLLKEANLLASRRSSYKNTMNIVMLTITAP